ncbi:MAG: 1-deoxy-D-xylulose-5-phosphate synthase [Oscillospiraceae bacterium]|nr:1-deoxy-D-xylulose-5-phosphate synthase [Oscillospiraceae bacterium]
MDFANIVDLNNLSADELDGLCASLRETIVTQVALSGGHLASNLGAVELTVALHMVYDTSYDRIVFDVGHQCYAHKLLTGRGNSFSTLRQLDGLSGFPKPSESVHDAFIAGHASTAVSVALGMARACALQGMEYDVAAVIGDGAMTGGMAYEALSDAGHSGLPIVVVLNDNEMSINKNVGGVARYMARLRLRRAYFNFKVAYQRLMRVLPGGKGVYKIMHRVKSALKDALFASSMFEGMGFVYLGPADGHDIPTLVRALRYARGQRKPVLVHVNTVKGKGCGFAERDPETYHGVQGYTLPGGAVAEARDSFADVMGRTVTELAASDGRICAVTAAMGRATGLEPFADAFAERFFDVGIAEQHAVTMAAGMAKQGLRPICAIYSTFLQRAFDQILHDVAIDKLPVVFAIDRTGIVGQDGETHHGIFDAGYLNLIPGLTVFSPASNAELDSALRWAFCQNEPAAVRYPRGCEGAYRGLNMEPAVVRDGSDVTLFTYGVTVNGALEAAEILSKRGISARVVKLCRITPFDAGGLIPLLTPRVLSVEEMFSRGGVSERLFSALMESGSREWKVASLTSGNGFVTHGGAEQLRALLSLDAEGIARAAAELCGNG